MSKERSPFPLATLGWTVRSIAALAALLALLVRPAEADIAVYVSPDGTNYGIQELTKTSPQAIDIYIEKDEGMGTSTSPCSDVTGENEGDEICGYDVVIQLLGFGCFEGTFGPGDGPVVYHPTDPFSCQTTKTLKATLVNVNPTLANPLHIGTLTVNADAEGPTDVRVLGNNIVAADLTLKAIPPDTIAYVPEPAEILLLAGGIAGLAGLHSLRRGSPSAR